MADLETNVVVNLAGNLAQKVPTYSNALSRFSALGQRRIGQLGRTIALAGRGIDRLGNRYTAFATGAAGVGTVRSLLSLEERMTRLGIQANVGAGDIKALTQEIFDVAQAPDIRVDPSELTSAIEEVVEKTGDLDFARENIRNLAAAISATGAEGGSIGGISAEFQKMGIVARDDVAEALDILTVQGKEGAFTLQNLAALGPRVVTAYTAMGREGVPAIREMGAALQVIRQGTGNAEQASTAFEALLRVLTDSKKRAELAGAGIQIFDADALKEGREVLRPINELLVEIVTAANGRKSVLQAFAGDEGGRAFNAIVGEFNRTGSIESIAKFYSVQADGKTILEDSARAAETGAGAMRALKAEWMELANNNLAQPLADVVKLFNSLDGETIQTTMKTLVAGAGAMIAMSAAGKVFRGVTGAARLIRGAPRAVSGAARVVRGVRSGGKISRVVSGAARATRGARGGIVGAVASAAAGTPVFVTNWPGALGSTAPAIEGAAAGKKLKGARGTARLLKAAPNIRSVAALGPAAMGIASAATVAAGGAGYAVGTGADKLLQQSEGGLNFRDRLGEVIATTLARLGNDKAQAAVATEERGKMNGALEINVTSDQGTRVRVGALRTENLDVEINNGAALVMP